jgi:hypothetical protein
MTVELNHTIVWARDKAASAAFLAEILGVPVGGPVGPFVPVRLGDPDGHNMELLTVAEAG